MSQTMTVKEESPLLNIALSKLHPGIFLHPVWIRFGRNEKKAPFKTIKALFIEAEKLKNENTSDACQLLLVSAVFQNYAGKVNDALATIQNVQNLAHRAKLTKEITWALWGASAICFQQKWYEQAAAHLTELKHILSDQDEWILAGFVDVVRQALPQQSKTGNAPIDQYPSSQTLDDLLAHTFLWLNYWGFSDQNIYENFYSHNDKESVYENKRPTSSFSGWQGLQLLFRGELKVNWMDTSCNSGRKGLSFWKFILSLLHINTAENLQQEPEIVELPTLDNVKPALLETQAPIILDESKCVQDITITVDMLGHFNMSVQEKIVNLPSSKSLSLLKYLMLHHKENIPRDILMDIFWSDVDPEKARNNLNVAMNGIRRVLRTITDQPIIIYKDNAYGVAPRLQLWMDVDEFERLINSGKRSVSNNRLPSAISDYEAAISLYQGDLLEENPYESWAVLPRERLRVIYLDTLDHLSQIYFEQGLYGACVTLCQLILARDICREDAHCRLMRCYSRMGQNFLALRQYQSCTEALYTELDVEPAPETVEMVDCIRRHEPV